MSFTINQSSTKLSSKLLFIYGKEDTCLSTFFQFDKDKINIVIKNSYEYTLNYTYKSIEIMQIKNKHYYYYKIFNLASNRIHLSTYIINKKNKEKTRRIITLKNIYPICLYSYFIYNKYYSIYNTNKKFYEPAYAFIDIINKKKLFNCREFYKIYSFI